MRTLAVGLAATVALVGGVAMWTEPAAAGERAPAAMAATEAAGEPRAAAPAAAEADLARALLWLLGDAADGRYAAMDHGQRAVLRRLVECCLRRLVPTQAAAELERLDAGGEQQLRFAWLGSRDRDQAHGFCIEGPRFVIEYAAKAGDGVGHTVFHGR